ncbi:hypothetical protein PENTCL1PPCAC_20531 [Pristionchus entomophagus]|uniref:Uncharacterized protein n=1 Tax=Pristionchus entomophagus TaxID=358040 RepID=A0AAV5TVA3_9BILA|nr:hypothetical protein PENTCL1PPCAC_20531 [Pristionchus entomophagus]
MPNRENSVDLEVAEVSVSQLLLDDDGPSGIRNVNPPRLDSLVSTVPTLGRTDSSFRPSQTSQPTSEQEDKEEEEEEDSVHSEFFITSKAKLETLFRRCQECGAPIDPISMEWRQVASALSVIYQCTGCREHFRWDTQCKKGRGKSQVFELNQSIPVAAFVTGTPIPRLSDLCKVLCLGLPSERSMRNSIRYYACPSIDRVYCRWEREARDISKDATPKVE